MSGEDTAITGGGRSADLLGVVMGSSDEMDIASAYRVSSSMSVSVASESCVMSGIACGDLPMIASFFTANAMASRAL